MNSTVYDIEPITKTKVNIVSKIEISIIELLLFKSVKVRVVLFDDNKNIINSNILTLTGQDYLNWKDDDNYIVDYVKTNINII